ncbi:hypothetical protein Q8A73_004038 [Channa argus]|nr:hypothetical protein Q8A73_004038 [Channa argus]
MFYQGSDKYDRTELRVHSSFLPPLLHLHLFATSSTPASLYIRKDPDVTAPSSGDVLRPQMYRKVFFYTGPEKLQGDGVQGTKLKSIRHQAQQELNMTPAVCP